MKTTTKDLIDALEAERSHRGLDHKGFSTLLRISETYWCRLRNGERRLTPNLAVEFMKNLPEITPAVTIFIMRQGNDGQNDNSGKAKPTPHATGRAKIGH